LTVGVNAAQAADIEIPDL